MVLQENGIQRVAGLAVLRPDKTDFKIKKVTREKDGHFVTIQETLPQEEITLFHIICTQHGGTEMYKATARTEGGN